MDNTLLISLVVAGIVAFVGWTIVSIISCKKETSDLKVHVAEKYSTNEDAAEMKHQIQRLVDKVDSMLELLYKINARFEHNQ